MGTTGAKCRQSGEGNRNRTAVVNLEKEVKRG